MNPNTLAKSLVGESDAFTYAKQIRGRLRAWYPRANELKGSTWSLTDEQTALVRAWHRARQAGKPFDFDAERKRYRNRKRAPKPNAPVAANANESE